MAMLCSALQAVVMVTLTTAFHIGDTVLPIQDSQYLNESRNNLEYTWSPAKLKKMQNLNRRVKDGIGSLYEYTYDWGENRCPRKLEQYRRLLGATDSPAFNMEFLLAYNSEITRSKPKKMLKILIKMEERIEKLIDTSTKEFGVFDSPLKKSLATTKELKKILED